MSLIAVEGTYEDGKIQLSEVPAGVKKSKVVVTFLSENGGAIWSDPESREAARQRAFARMEAGLDLGGGKFSRDEVYAERLEKLEHHQQPDS